MIVEPGLIQTEFGGVLTDPMLKRSGTGAYAKLAQLIAQAASAPHRTGRGSSPSVIADIVAKAVEARRPRTRYAAGKFAKPLLVARKWLSDRLFDRTVMGFVR